MWPFTSRSPRPRSTRPSYRPRLESLEDRCLLSGPGSLDTTFGTGGLVTTSFTRKPLDSVSSVAVQTDGKIIAAGAITTNAEIARYNPNGTLDSTFGTGGKVTTPLTSALSAWGFTLQPDGKIVVGTNPTDGSAFELARYNTNGTLDTTFGPSHNGTLFTNSGSSASLILKGLTIETVSGVPKLVATARWGDGTSPTAFALVRYNMDGSLDSSFGTVGEVIGPRTTFYWSVPFVITSQADGKLLVGGRGGALGGSNQSIIARYDTSGNLDPAFGSGGYAIESSPTNGDGVYELAVQPDGKIVAGGYVNGAAALVRLNVGVPGLADGSLDSTFGNGGIASADVVFIPEDGATSLVIQTNGKIVIATNNGVVNRYNADGSLDTGFGTDGTVSMPSGASANSVALQSDGMVVVAGQTANNRTGNHSFAVARFLGDPIPVIGSFKANPNPVTSGSTTTLTISNITDSNANSSITRVAIYLDSNADGKLEPGSDTLLGYAIQTGPGVWTFNYTVNLAAGTYTLFAQAEDNYGLFSDPLALTLSVQ
jgi:uncharacterized delta-60 repeat protein